MLSCRQVTEIVTDYTEGRLSVVDWLRFQLHLGMCRHCREYLRQVKATASALGKLPAPELTPELRDELVRRFDGWKKTRS
jgi:predicted anti-sigma-YlaC factor YlaD